MKVILIEDELYIRTIIRSFISKMNKNLNVINECESVNEAVKMVNTHQPDLVFLDVNLIGGSAFEFLDKVDNLSFKIIFVTAHEEFALQALKQGAVDYILKPIDPVELEAAIDKVIQCEHPINKTEIHEIENQWNKGMDNLVLSLQDGFQVIKLDELEFCKSDKGYTKFYLTDGRSFLASGLLKDYEHRLPSSFFFRVHKSFIINLKCIDKFNRKGYIISKNNHEIPVSNRRKEAFMSILLNQ